MVYGAALPQRLEAKRSGPRYLAAPAQQDHQASRQRVVFPVELVSCHDPE
mgnify:CR=1 FL=1